MAIEKDVLDQLLAGRDPKDVFGKDGLVDELKKALSERILNTELDEHLDAENADGKSNQRNGYSKKSVLTATSKVTLAVPRDRAGTFDPQLIAKYQRRFPDFDDKIISMYARGMSVRVIALENLIIMMLAEGSDRQLELAREMAAYISPRPGFTHHPLTTQAAAHMVDLVDRGVHYRSVDPVMTAAQPTLAKPYKSTPVFDEVSLPAGLRREHRTKAGSWGVIRVLEGRLRYQVLDPSSEVILEPGHPGLILPEQPHLVEPLGPIRMQIEFYDHLPDL